MEARIYVTQDMKRPRECNIDLILREIPIVDEIIKRIDDCPMAFTVGYMVACSIAEHINMFIPVTLGIDECFKKDVEFFEEAKAYIKGKDGCY